MKTKKLVYGVGINDADYVVRGTRNGKITWCPYYRKWESMIQRVFCPIIHFINKNYAKCSIAPEWLTFSIFKKWMQTQEWEGKELDKDLRVVGNFHYSPETCYFISRELNKTLITPTEGRELPQGVYANKTGPKDTVRVMITHNKKYTYIGTFKSIEEGNNAYLKAKTRILNSYLEVEKDCIIQEGLKAHIKALNERKQHVPL